MKNLLPLLFVFLCIAGKSQSVVPQKGSGSTFSLTCANLYFEIDSARGARICSFKLDGNELMYVNFSGGNDMAGSTFWQSPQIWPWPPSATLNNKPYKSNINGSKVKFTGSTDSQSNLRFYKTMYASSSDTSIVIEYTIKNEKSAAQNWAPWEITRVLGKGLTVFAQGEGSITGDMKSRTEELDGYGWYDQDATKGGSGNKIFCDGQGWLAHVIDGDKLFIKKFADIPKASAAPNEAEVEVYTAPGNVYTELENQGAYGSIASKDSITWRVKWFARNLPASVDVSVGSSSLTSYIEAVLKREAPVSSGALANKGTAKIYPNPVSKILTIETDLKSGNEITLRIIDLQGRIVLTKNINNSRNQINIENLKQGIYIYDLKQGIQTLSKGQLSIQH